MTEAALEAAHGLFDFTRDLRRDLHQHPEIGFQEVRTAGIVARELNALGLEVVTGIAQTGVVGLLEGGLPGPVMMLRFDMDALPITEQTGAAYASRTPGLMHACGHDGHVAVGLTVARILAAQRAALPGTVKFVFQPAEEGLGGAQGMVDAGVLRDPAPQVCLGLHLWNEKPLGWLGVTPGPMMAGADTFRAQITGRGGHGALPQRAVDPIAAAAQWISALQTIVSRNVSPLQSGVVSVTSIHAGETFNVIPPAVSLQGTVRSFELPVRDVIWKRFDELLHGICGAMGCQASVQVDSVTPAVVNDPAVTAVVQQAAARLLPEAQIDPGYQTMGSEDMAYYMQQVPGCFFFVGSANPERGLDYGHHHPKFDFDEAALPHAAAIMAQAALDLLAGPAS